MSDIVSALRYATPMALVAGGVWYLVTSLSGDPDWFDGALFIVVFGVVVTLGRYDSSERER